MCELQFIKRIDDKKLDTEDIKSFVKLLEFGSLNNNDAFGVFNHQIIYKQKGLIDFKGFDINLLKNYNFIVGHNRLKTSGDTSLNANNHPFIIGDFILAHNGIVHNDAELKHAHEYTKKIATDSITILYLINKYFILSNAKDRQSKVIEAIKRATKLIEGSLSVFLIDSITRDIYYFKNTMTDFHFYQIQDNLLVGTTSARNMAYVYLDEHYKTIYPKKSIIELELKDNRIYLINDSQILKDCGKFKTQPITSYGFEGYSNFQGYPYVSDISNKAYKGDFPHITDDKELVVTEIDNILMEYLGYIPDYTLKDNDKTILINYFDEQVKNVFADCLEKNNGKEYIKIRTNDLLSLYYGYGGTGKQLNNNRK